MAWSKVLCGAARYGVQFASFTMPLAVYNAGVTQALGISHCIMVRLCL